jgi:signal peptidase I
VSQEQETSTVSEAKSWILETGRTIIYAVLIAMVIRTFAYEPFNIPSESMLPTLKVGDYLFVSKFSYGYSRHSMPFSPPVFDGRIFGRQPERGDVIVFKLPRDNKTDYIKRLIGLPGDRIQMRNGILHINDKAVPREPIQSYVHDRYSTLRRIPQFRETLPNGVSYETLDSDPLGRYDTTKVYTVPDGHYFMMGDNRDNSQDSRVSNAVGFVPAENLVGRAEILFFSHDGSAAFWEVWKWPSAIRFRRFFNLVD